MSEPAINHGFVASINPLDFQVHTEVDDSGLWWRGVISVHYVMPMSAGHGDTPGVETDSRTIWFGPWRQHDPRARDLNAGERLAIRDAMDRLTERLVYLFRDGDA